MSTLCAHNVWILSGSRKYHSCPAFLRNLSSVSLILSVCPPSPSPLFLSLSLSPAVSVSVSLSLCLSLSQKKYDCWPTFSTAYRNIYMSSTCRLHVVYMSCRLFLESRSCLQGGEDAYDALSHKSLSAKETLIIRLFCGKWPVEIRHPTHLRHPVVDVLYDSFVRVTWLIYGTWRVHMCNVIRWYLWYDAFICVTWRIHMCGATRWHMWHDVFIRGMWCIHMCGVTRWYVWHDAFTCVMWRIPVCGVTRWHLGIGTYRNTYLDTHMSIHRYIYVDTHSTPEYVRHDSFICETWLIHMCDMNYLYVWHDSFICVTWLIHTCDMTHSYVRHDSCICVPWLIHTCDMTLSHVWDDSLICDDTFICETWLMTHMCRRLNAR